MRRLPLLASIALLPGCATEDLKKAYADATSSSADSKSRPVDITVVAQKSSTVVDQNCPRLVQPYRLSDNAMSLGKMGAELAMQNALASFQTKMNAPAGQKVDVLATAKLAAKQLNWMPMNIERMYSEWRQKELENNVLPRTKRTEKKYAYADKILADVIASIDEPHDYDLKLFILKTDHTNAMALPAGFLYVDEGLLNPKFKEKAYFAIAHETAHILQRHETKELESTVIDAIGVASDLMKLLDGPNMNPGAILNLAAGTKGLFSKHFQDQELQADACATKMMMKIFPRPEIARKALHDFTESLGKLDPEPQLKPPANDIERYAISLHTMVSSPYRRHPNTALRRQNIDQMYVQITMVNASVASSPGDNSGAGIAAADKPRSIQGVARKKN